MLEALKADPKHQKALALAGTAFNSGDFAKAADWWKQLLATLPPGSEQAKAVQANIAQAEAGGATVAARPSAPADNGAAAAGASVEGSVTLADAVKAGVSRARCSSSTRGPPTAAACRWPSCARARATSVRFKLDDSLAMAPQAKLSLHPEVMLVARISKTGNATPQPGDITGALGPVKVGAPSGW